VQDRVEFVREQVRNAVAKNLPEQVLAPKVWLDGSQLNPAYEEIGRKLLNKNKVAVLMLAGGLSTRLGLNVLRGNLPVGPVTKRSIFRLQGEKIAAIRERYAPDLLWFVMTSPDVHQATIDSFEDEGYFGVPSDSVYFFPQTSFPVVDEEGQPVLLPDGRYMEAPSGHGDLLKALECSGLLERLQGEGIDYLFHFQYPNVLENVCDPVMIGYHHVGKFGVTVKAITNYSSEEPVGRCVEVEGKLQIIEYHFCEDSISSLVWDTAPASTGTFVWSISFLSQCVEKCINPPFYVLPCNLPANSNKPLYKIEQLVFDLLPYSSKSGLMVVRRNEEYAPIKTMSGIYSINSGKEALIRLYRGWLEKAGVVAEEKDYVVEISPKYALNYQELELKIYPGFHIYNNMVLEST
jgi:UDP-N-acetylglucosamine/UDP-N-acetylgalactosamine diphosphorylase